MNNTLTSISKIWKEKSIIVFFVLLMISIVLYADVLNKGFSADDFMVIRRVGLERNILIKGFFRPLSDITLYLTYRIFGLHPVYYNLFNLLVHVTSGFLIFLFCKKVDWIRKSNNSFAWLAALLFVSYPFHNEAIVWVVGRGSGMATLFALASLLSVLYMQGPWKYLVVCVLYLVGLTAYESIFTLPLMVILLEVTDPGRGKLKSWVTAFAVTLLCHFLLRFWLSSAIIGEYAGELLQLRFYTYVSHFFKILGRLFLPPHKNSGLLIFSFVLVMLFLVSAIVFLSRKTRELIVTKKGLYLIILLLLCSLIVPVTFAVSTKTSESDRLLYFPSVFVCLLVAYLIIGLFYNAWARLVISLVFLLYNIYFLRLNNNNWKEASAITQSIIQKSKTLAGTKKQILLLNVPTELNGAFIFRNGFEDAMVLNGIGKDKVRAMNLLDRQDDDSMSQIINPTKKNEGIFIPPSVLFYSNEWGDRFLRISDSITVPIDSTKQEIWYWNKKNIVKLNSY